MTSGQRFSAAVKAKFAALPIILALAACSSQLPAVSMASFTGHLRPLCQELQRARADFRSADKAQDFSRASLKFLAAYDEFIVNAKKLEPPLALKHAFARYLKRIEMLAVLNRRSLQDQLDRGEVVDLQIEAGEAGVDAYQAKVAARLPDSCPPASKREVFRLLFVGRGNLACLGLGSQIEKLGRLQAKADTPRETGELLEFAEAITVSLKEALRESVPLELEDPDAERLIALHEERAIALRMLKEAFATKDQSAYEQWATTEHNAAEKADTLAQSMGLVECVGFLKIAAR